VTLFDSAKGGFCEKSSLHLPYLIYAAKPLRQSQAQSAQQYFLCFIRCGYTAQPYDFRCPTIACPGGQNHITALDPGKFL